MPSIKTEYYARLILIISKCGTLLTKKLFEKRVKDLSPNDTISDFLEKHKREIYQGKIEEHIKRILFPQNGQINIQKWDLSLFCFLLQLGMCDLQQINRQDIRKLRDMRNDIYHLSEPAQSASEFQSRLTDIKEVFRRTCIVIDDDGFETELNEMVREFEEDNNLVEELVKRDREMVDREVCWFELMVKKQDKMLQKQDEHSSKLDVVIKKIDIFERLFSPETPVNQAGFIKLEFQNCTTEINDMLSKYLATKVNELISGINIYSSEEFQEQENETLTKAAIKIHEEFGKRKTRLMKVEVSCLLFRVECVTLSSCIELIKSFHDGSVFNHFQDLLTAVRSVEGCENVDFYIVSSEDEIIDMIDNLVTALERLLPSVDSKSPVDSKEQSSEHTDDVKSSDVNEEVSGARRKQSEHRTEHEIATRERNEYVRPREIQGHSDGNGQATQQGGEATSRGLHGEDHTDVTEINGVTQEVARSAISKVLTILVDFMNPTPILQRMIETELLRRSTLVDIMEQKTSIERSRCLLNVVSRKDVTVYIHFKKCLCETKQEHIVRLLEIAEKGEDTEDAIKMIKQDAMELSSEENMLLKELTKTIANLDLKKKMIICYVYINIGGEVCKKLLEKSVNDLRPQDTDPLRWTVDTFLHTNRHTVEEIKSMLPNEKIEVVFPKANLEFWDVSLFCIILINTCKVSTSLRICLEWMLKREKKLTKYNRNNYERKFRKMKTHILTIAGETGDEEFTRKMTTDLDQLESGLIPNTECAIITNKIGIFLEEVKRSRDAMEQYASATQQTQAEIIKAFELKAMENEELFDKIVQLCVSNDREGPEVIMLIGRSGAGKSALINTIHKVITGDYYQITKQGSGHVKPVTLELKRFDNCGVNLQTISDDDRRLKIERVIGKLPRIFDFVGLEDINTPALAEILNLLVGGFIPEGTQIAALEHIQKEYGTGSLKRIFKTSDRQMVVTKVVFVQSCMDEIPKQLIECLNQVLTITDRQTLTRKYTAEVFPLLTKYDLVQDSDEPLLHLEESISLEEFEKVEKDIAPLFNIPGALRKTCIRWASITDRVDSNNPYIASIALKFLQRMLEPVAGDNNDNDNNGNNDYNDNDNNDKTTKPVLQNVEFSHNLELKFFPLV